MPLFTVLIFYNEINSQPGKSLFYDFNHDNDGGWKMIKAKDNYYVLCGNYCHQNTIPCSGILAFDHEWNLLWKKELDSLSLHYFDCLTTDDEYLYITATTSKYAGFDYILLKYNLTGNLIDSAYFGPFNENRLPMSINYFNRNLFVNLYFPHDPNKSGYDSTAILQFNTNLELELSFTNTDKTGIENLIGYIGTSDSNYVGFKSIQKSKFAKIGRVNKFNSNGKVIWKKDINYESKYPQFYSLQKIRTTSDGGFVGIWNQSYEALSNDTFSEQPLLFKLDSTGKMIWNHIFYSKRRKYLYSIFETKNKDIIALGIDENTGETSRFKSSGWVVRFTQFGDLLWEHTYIDSISRDGYSHLFDGYELEDERLVFCGLIKPKRDSSMLLHSDVWIILTDSKGCLIKSCEPVQITTKTIGLNNEDEINFKFNLANNLLSFDSNTKLENLLVNISSLDGKILITQSNVTFPLNLNIESLNSGIYLVSLYSPQNRLHKNFKFIKL